MFPGTRIFRPCKFFPPLAAALLCSACGDGRPTVYPVRGSVFFQGKPAHKAVVFLVPVSGDTERDSPATGLVDAEGNFAITTYKTGDGALPGQYKVTFVWKSDPVRGDSDQIDLLPLRYMDPKQSPYRVTVTDQPIDLGRYDLTNR